MKSTTIRVAGKQIFENSDELDIGYAEIELEAYDILREIDSEDVADYARWSLDMKHEDDFESSLDDFDEDELVKALEDSGYNFSKQIGEEDCIEFLEDSGYIVSTPKELNEYDYVDSSMLSEITEVFFNATMSERKYIYGLIKNKC